MSLFSSFVSALVIILVVVTGSFDDTIGPVTQQFYKTCSVDPLILCPHDSSTGKPACGYLWILVPYSFTPACCPLEQGVVQSPRLDSCCPPGYAAYAFVGESFFKSCSRNQSGVPLDSGVVFPYTLMQPTGLLTLYGNESDPVSLVPQANCAPGPVFGMGSLISEKWTLYIGDSIAHSMALGLDETEWVASPADYNYGGSRSTAYFLTCFEAFTQTSARERLDPSAVLFNAGIHDLNLARDFFGVFASNGSLIIEAVSRAVDVYKTRLGEIISKLKRVDSWGKPQSPALVFATTTPYLDASMDALAVMFAKAALEVVTAAKTVAVLDLHGIVRDECLTRYNGTVVYDHASIPDSQLGLFCPSAFADNVNFKLSFSAALARRLNAEFVRVRSEQDAALNSISQTTSVSGAVSSSRVSMSNIVVVVIMSSLLQMLFFIVLN